MKILVVLLCSAVVLVAVGAKQSSYKPPNFHDHNPNSGYGGSPGYGSSHSSSYHPSPSKGGGYGGSSTQYGHSGYSPYGHGFHSFQRMGSGDKPFTELDKLYETARDILMQVKFLSEALESASAALSVQEKKLSNLIHIVFTKMEETDIKQNSSIAKLKEHLRDLEADDDSLYDHLHNLTNANDENLYQGELADKLWARLQAATFRNQRAVFTLRVDVRDVKNKLFQVKNNEFWAFLKWVERLDTRVESIKKRENRRMCEVGQVTLKKDDQRAEPLFHTWFDNAPQMLYGLAGFKFNLKDKDKSVNPFPYHYIPKKEASAIGVIVHAYATKTGLVVKMNDLSAGKVSLVTVDVTYQACTLKPGASPVKH